jgi:predicted TIM-barrel fold metal-dependent hydrolase
MVAAEVARIEPSAEMDINLVEATGRTKSIRPYVEEAIGIFGVDRCMFASNFPVDKLFSSYDAIFDAFQEITKDYPYADRIKLFHDNAERYYKL